jgi:hypothetical protein
MAVRNQRGRSRGAAIYGDLDGVHASMDLARGRHLDGDGDRATVTFWRQCLTVSAAAKRARAGNQTAARRLAWREEYLAEIAQLPDSVQTYAVYRRREQAAAGDADTWLRRQLDGLDDGSV